MPEGPHAIGVGVRDGADGADAAGLRSSTRPTTAEPGCSVCGGKLPSGPAGIAITGRPTRFPVASSARPSAGSTPLTVSGAVSGRVPSRRMRRIAAAARGEAAAARPACGRGGSTGFASIDSIGVASTAFPP